MGVDKIPTVYQVDDIGDKQNIVWVCVALTPTSTEQRIEKY